MSKFITAFVNDLDYGVEVHLKNTSLSIEQVQVLSGLMFQLHHLDCDLWMGEIPNMKYSLDGNVLTDEYQQETFTWEGDVITHTWLDDGSTDTYQVTRKDGYVIIHNDDDTNSEVFTATFKDGMLESMDDQAAVRFSSVVEPKYINQIWYQANICYRAANPDLPSGIVNDYRYHHNAQGKLHRSVSVGPAVYPIVNGEVVKEESAYYVDGLQVEGITV